MRRYFPTLLFILALLVLGGAGISWFTGERPPIQGQYIPTLSADPQQGQIEGLILVGAVVGTVVLTVGLGGALAFAFHQYSRAQAAQVPQAEPAPASAAPARPAAKAPAEAPGVPLTRLSSQIIFWVALTALVGAFLVVTSAGKALGYLPSPAELANMPLLQLPGEHIPGLPSFIAGPGDTLTALQAIIGLVGGALAATGVIGWFLARGLFVLEGEAQRPAADFPRTAVDRLIAAVEARIQKLLHPQPRAPQPPPSLVDRGFRFLNVLLLVALVVVVAIWAIPPLGRIRSVNQAIEATRAAALATPTPVPPPSIPSAEALKEELASLPSGNVAGGEAAAAGKGACAACHITAAVGPAWLASADPNKEGVGVRAEKRFKEAGYAGVADSAAGYLLESILLPNAYVVPGFQPDVMPKTLGSTLSKQDLADLLAYLESLK